MIKSPEAFIGFMVFIPEFWYLKLVIVEIQVRAVRICHKGLRNALKGTFTCKCCSVYPE